MRLGPACRPRRWPGGAAGPAGRLFLLSSCVILCDNVHTMPRAADLNGLTGGLGDVTGTGLPAALSHDLLLETSDAVAQGKNNIFLLSLEGLRFRVKVLGFRV